MAQFKVKYKTRQRLQRAIEQEIEALGLVDSRDMKRSIRVSSVSGEGGDIVVMINCLYYYVFQDLGAPRANIRANDITERALRRPQGQKFIEEVYQAYVNYIDERYKILDTSRLVISAYTLKYNIYGGAEYGYPDGEYNPNVRLKV